MGRIKSHCFYLSRVVVSCDIMVNTIFEYRSELLGAYPSASDNRAGDNHTPSCIANHIIMMK